MAGTADGFAVTCENAALAILACEPDDFLTNDLTRKRANRKNEKW
jgi:hypothetical protein